MMGRIERDQIKKEKLILCEGRDEERFLFALINDGLSDEPGFADDIQIFDFGGVNDLSLKLESYKKMEGFDNVTHLMIIRDAELDVNGAIQSIQVSLKHNGFQAPKAPCQWIYDTKNDIYIGFLLFPTCDGSPTTGALEDLCLKILVKQDAKECVDEVRLLTSRLENIHGKSFRHKLKTQLHAYFAVSDDYVGMKIGEAANSKAFDWSSVELESLKSFVLHMVQDREVWAKS